MGASLPPQPQRRGGGSRRAGPPGGAGAGAYHRVVASLRRDGGLLLPVGAPGFRSPFPAGRAVFLFLSHRLGLGVRPPAWAPPPRFRLLPPWLSSPRGVPAAPCPPLHLWGPPASRRGASAPSSSLAAPARVPQALGEPPARPSPSPSQLFSSDGFSSVCFSPSPRPFGRARLPRPGRWAFLCVLPAGPHPPGRLQLVPGTPSWPRNLAH